MKRSTPDLLKMPGGQNPGHGRARKRFSRRQSRIALVAIVFLVIAIVVWLAQRPQHGQARWLQARPTPSLLTLAGPTVESELSTANLDEFTYGRGLVPGAGLKYDRDGVDGASGYDNGQGYKTLADQAFGSSSKTAPASEACELDARTGGRGKTAVARLQPGINAWCVITPKGNLAWVHLISGGGTSLAPTAPLPELEFEEILWRPA